MLPLAAPSAELSAPGRAGCCGAAGLGSLGLEVAVVRDISVSGSL